MTYTEFNMEQKRKRRIAVQAEAPMLMIGNQELLTAASAAITAVLTLPGHVPETYQEAMRTLAIIAKSPLKVTVENCNFDARKTFK